jgi:hypothetical protein
MVSVTLILQKIFTVNNRKPVDNEEMLMHNNDELNTLITFEVECYSICSSM